MMIRKHLEHFFGLLSFMHMKPCLGHKNVACIFFIVQKFLSKVEEMFLCICCQEVVHQPITTECQHNVCKVEPAATSLLPCYHSICGHA